ncbi:MAG: carboxypeptidase-like regulatory domain-containing protein [Runella slithyformis]|nr:MAG: carboxypeptidase-like regulatory domain-containing protein [Runella slithyformis]TAF27710.1 MAG: carboxypeptidase-like regulatory domain-containing protein [Runella slithyformis]TAF44612.1 MAG: carboxypeptidase-like regulatory domain-containing protein [Runella slithyformis]TAF80899.1 MAG: carboxypeptidase-like regulatory domain-containing protein [Runella slithyformis]
MMKHCCTVVFCFVLQIAHAQNRLISGKILDGQSKQPLAFVSVGIEGTRRGTVSDIDGKFTISASVQSVFLVSYVGFESKRIMVSDVGKGQIIIELSQKINDIGEVIVRPGINPAHRIIKLTIANKSRNDPAQYEAFQYNSYTITGLSATVQNIRPSNPEKLKKYQQEQAKNQKKDKPRTPTQLQKDSTMRAIGLALFENYVLVNETHTLKQYQRPNISIETVLATKLSGLEKSPLALVPSNFQPFGFYTPFFSMTDGRDYESPLTNGAIRRYDFDLLDTLVHETDSTFVIAFMPKNGKNFEALKGLLYINSNGYAVENVIAEPAETQNRKMRFKMQQKYERVAGKWFPHQLNTEIIFPTVNERKQLGRIDSTTSKWTTRSYIYNVRFDKIKIKPSPASISQQIDEDARSKPDSYWEQIRPDTLDKKAQKTYEAYAKMPDQTKKQLNRKVNFVTDILLTGALPLGKYLEIPFSSFLAGVNQYERFRLGAGLRTSVVFSKKVVLEGSMGYGFGDNAFKYGGSVRFNINQLQTNYVKIGYSRDIEEPANVTSVFKEYAPNLMATNSLRQFMTTRFDSVSRWSVELGLRPLPKTQLKFWALNEMRKPAQYNYEFLNQEPPPLIRNVANTEIGFTFRVSSDEKLNRTGRRIYATELPKRLLLVQASRGVGALNGQLSYSKLQLQYTQSIMVRGLGRTEFRAEAAKIWGNVPYYYLFNGNGSNNGRTQLFIPYTFQTMGLYEFLSDQYANLFVSHDFGRLLYRSTFKYSQPALSVHHSMGFGSLQNPLAHSQLTSQSLKKGYNESGILVRNLFQIEYQKIMYLGLGAGAFYRYGNYALPENTKNWTLRLGFTASF